MSDTFDPYYEWLGIPPKDQPPNHYRLLGIERLEDNLNVIERAADRQMAHIRTYQAGRRGPESQKLLNQISAAKLCLLDPERKRAYDDALRQDAPPAAEVSDPTKLTFDGTIGGESLPPLALPGAPAPNVPAMTLPQPVATPAPANPAPTTPVATSSPAETTTPLKDFHPDDVPASRVRKRVRRVPWWQKPIVLIILVGIVVLLAVLYSLVSGPASVPTSPAAYVPPTPPPAPSESNEPEADPSESITTDSDPVSSEEPIDPPTTDPVEEVPAVPPTNLVSGLPSLSGEEVPAEMNMPGETMQRPASNSHPLRFRGRDRVEIQQTQGLTDPAQTFTAELWLRLDPAAPSPGHYLLGNGVMRGFHPEVQDTALAGWLLMLQSLGGGADGEDSVVFRVGRPGSTSPATGRISTLGSEWHHVAVTNAPLPNGDWQVRVFVDGAMAIEKAFTAENVFPSPENLHLGTAAENAPGLQFHGEIRGFRLSSSVRYTDSFKPDETFESDEATLALLDFRGSPVTQVDDLSGADRHGRMLGPEWSETQAALAVHDEPKLPVPDVVALRTAERRLTTDYQNLIDAADTPAALINVASSLLDDAMASSDAATQYHYLDKSRTLAVKAIDPHLWSRAIDELAGRFEVDRWELQSEALRSAQASARSAAQKQTVAETALQFAMDAGHDESFDVATRLIQIARRSSDATIKRRATDEQRELAHDKRMYAAAQTARETLQSDPQNQDARTALGKYLALRRNEWKEGLIHLVRGSDANLVDLAQRDQNYPASPADQQTLGDAWNDWARTASASDKNGGWRRAQHWYQLAVGQLNGAEKEAVDAKLTELAEKITVRDQGGAKLTFLDGEPGYIRRLAGHRGAVDHLAAPSSGGRLVSAAADATLRVWDLASGEAERTIEVETTAIRGLALTANNQLALVGGGGARLLEVWQVATGEPVPPGIPVDGYTGGMSATRGGQLLWASAGGPPGNLRLLDMVRGTSIAQMSVPSAPSDFACSASGRLVLALDRTNAVHVWTLAGGSGRQGMLPTVEEPILDLAVAPNDRVVAACTNFEVILWDVSTGRELHRLMQPDETFRHIVFSRDSRRLYGSSQSSALSVWDVSEGQRLDLLTSPGGMNGQTTSITLLSDPRGAVTGDSGGAIHLWRVPE